MLTFLGFGHSHVVAIAKGCYELQQAGEVFAGSPLLGHFLYLFDAEFMPTLTDAEGEQTLNPRIVEKIEQTNPRFILLTIGGNEHNALSVLQLPQRFDFILGEAPDLPLDPGADILPEAVVREVIRERMEGTIAIVRAFRRSFDLPLAQMEPPPPLPAEQILAYPKEFFKRVVDPKRLSTETFRYKVWRIQANLYRELCGAEDVVYVPVPADLQDDTGLLARAAWGHDATHANGYFGQRMIRELMLRIGERIRADG
ncbi:MAG: hypothetical protein C3F11_01770 [Methylocystaceae bacterium]|nr:MAG: hypothetical protein C3F11_01770 [Methylocystaceae bacterium]